MTRPFHDASPWNLRIDRATLVPVPELKGMPVGTSSSQPDDWRISMPVYQATKTDPVWDVAAHADVSTLLYSGRIKAVGNDAGTESMLLPGLKQAGKSLSDMPTYASQGTDPAKWVKPQSFQPAATWAGIYAPSGIRPARGRDSWIAVIQPNGTAFEAFGAVVLSNRRLAYLFANEIDLAGMGDGHANGVRASMIPALAGCIRTEEMKRNRIDHAIALAVPARLLHPSWVYPALTFDRGAMTESPPYSGSCPMGTRLLLRPAFDLGRLKTAAGRAIGSAMQTHGGIIVDRGGDGITWVCEEHQAPIPGWTDQTPVWDDLSLIRDNLARVVSL